MDLQTSIKRLKATTVQAMDSTHEYSDTEGEDAMRYRWDHLRDQKKVKTSVPGLTIIVGTGSGSGGYDYYAFLVVGDHPQGYVRFQYRFGIPSWWLKKVYTPHSYIRRSYRGLGYISSLYKWFLSSGRALLCSFEHSSDASALWNSLLSKYPHVFVRHTQKDQFVVVDADDKTDSTSALIATTQELLNKLIEGL